MTPAEYCRDRILRSRSSFFYPLLFLAPEKRDAMFAVYAFCREVDDIADGGLTPMVAEAKLAWWKNEVAEIFDGEPRHPAAQALQLAVTRFQLPSAPFLAMIQGMEMDLQHRPFQSLADLERYAERVAVTVGQLTMRIFGAVGESAERFSRHLGLAFQFTNILRDVVEDARRKRVYVPREFLTAAGVDPAALLDGQWPPGMERALAPLAAAAREHYRQARNTADGGTPFLAALVMAGIYEAYLTRIEAVGFDVAAHPVRFSAARKLWLCWQAWRREKHRLRG